MYFCRFLLEEHERDKILFRVDGAWWNNVYTIIAVSNKRNKEKSSYGDSTLIEDRNAKLLIELEKIRINTNKKMDSLQEVILKSNDKFGNDVQFLRGLIPQTLFAVEISVNITDEACKLFIKGLVADGKACSNTDEN